MAKKKTDKLFKRPTGAATHKKNQAGRPTKFNEEIADKIVQYILMGSYVETAAQAAGISKNAFYEWLKTGAHDKEQGKTTLKSKFNDAVSEAVGKSLQRDLLTVDNAAKKDWRAAAWKMERRAPSLWGPKAAMKIEGDKKGFTDEENLHAQIANAISEIEGDE